MIDEVQFGELLARNESLQRELSEFKRTTHRDMATMSTDMDAVVEELRSIKLLLSKWKGFVGGITAVVSLVWAIGLYIADVLSGKVDLL